MARFQLAMLPMELLQAISHLLYISHQPSLASFSLVNRICRRAATPWLFRKLCVRIKTERRLLEDVDQWYSILRANDSFRYVRQMVISNDVKRYHIDANTTDPSSTILDPFEDDEFWESLTNFIGELPVLEDMYLRSNMPVPLCLHRALQVNTFPMCRLHISEFHLTGLPKPTSVSLSQPTLLAPIDLALIKSSNLYAIVFHCSHQQQFRHRTCSPDALFELVARACPALREVKVVRVRPRVLKRTPQLQQYDGSVFDQNENASLKPPGSKAQLTSLALESPWPQLEKWERHTDFKFLQTLEIAGHLNPEVVNWAAESAHFSALSHFEIRVSEENASSVANFLYTLPNLKDLSILGDASDAVMMAIKQKHGVTLQCLSYRSFACSIDTLTSLREACPLLSHLVIRVRRTQGDANEVAIYHTLGTFPQIKSLIVDLDCTIDISDEPDIDTNTATRMIQSTLINCAIDSALAASIFDKIDGAKLSGSTPLHTLELNTLIAGVTITRSFDSAPYYTRKARVYRHFERSWSCSRHPRDDWLGGVVAVEQEELKLGREQEEATAMEFHSMELGELEEAFRGLWPGGVGDWREEWMSFALVD